MVFDNSEVDSHGPAWHQYGKPQTHLRTWDRLWNSCRLPRLAIPFAQEGGEVVPGTFVVRTGPDGIHGELDLPLADFVIQRPRLVAHHGIPAQYSSIFCIAQLMGLWFQAELFRMSSDNNRSTKGSSSCHRLKCCKMNCRCDLAKHDMCHVECSFIKLQQACSSRVASHCSFCSRC